MQQCSCPDLILSANKSKQLSCLQCACPDVRFVAPECTQPKTEYLGGADVIAYAAFLMGGVIMFALSALELYLLICYSKRLRKSATNFKTNCSVGAKSNRILLSLITLMIASALVIITSAVTIDDLLSTDEASEVIPSDILAAFMGNMIAVATVMVNYTWIYIITCARVLSTDALRIHGVVLRWTLLIGTPVTLAITVVQAIFHGSRDEALNLLATTMTIVGAIIAVIILMIVVIAVLPKASSALRWIISGDGSAAIRSPSSLRAIKIKTLSTVVSNVNTVALLLLMATRIPLPPGTSITVWGRYILEVVMLAMLLVSLATSWATVSKYSLRLIGIAQQNSESSMRSGSISTPMKSSDDPSSIQHSSLHRTEEEEECSNKV